MHTDIPSALADRPLSLVEANGACCHSDHYVQFYEDDDYLAQSLASFIGAALGVGDVALVIATPAHRETLVDRLTAQGFNVAFVEAQGRLVLLDAADTLAEFMVNGLPDEERFMRTVGERVAKAVEGGKALRAFGEMVALLWADGNAAAAVRLEELWNKLAQEHSFTLFCAYPMDAFSNSEDRPEFAKICAAHRHVIPTERYVVSGSDAHRLGYVAELQQQAVSLKTEMNSRAEAERKLRRREAELTDFIENASIGLHWVGPDGIIQWANKAEYDLLGYAADEYIGQHIAKFHADQHVIEDILRRLARGERLRDYEAQLKCKDGSIRHVLIDSSVLRENGQIIRQQCFTRDVTEIRRAQDAVQRLAAIVQSSDDAIISKDLNGIITTWNQGAERIFGYTAEEMIGKPVTILMPPERVNEEPGILERIRSGKMIDHYETVRRRKDGTLLTISLTVSPIKNREGKVVGASKVARDISDKVRAREQLETMVAERTAQLRDTVAELEGFSYSIAHDMRAPLRAMNGYARLLLEDFGQSLPESGKDFARRIASAGGRLDSLITDVLNYSRISRCEMPLVRVDVEQLIRDIVDSYPDLHESGATIMVQSPIPPVVGNIAALTQCIANLLSNAVKFVPPERKPQVHIRAERHSDHVRLCVQDNGIGISEQGKNRIFGMFQRLHPVGEFEGTGIGLTIVRKAAERMGGRVGVESGSGVGSTFWIELKPA